MQKRIHVQDETRPQEVLNKKERWGFNGSKPLRTVKLTTHQQPQSLGINVTDSSKTGEKIG